MAGTKTTTKAAAQGATKPAAKRTITLRLKKGLVACNPKQRATINGLGLKHREQVVTLENTSAVRGMVKKVLHLVDVVSQTV